MTRIANSTTRAKAILAAYVTCMLAAPSFAIAQAFDLSWNTIDGGGGMNSTGGSFSLSSTIGQPDAQVAPVMTGGAFELTGGFWPVANVCTCPGDTNGDGLRNGRDVQSFVQCVTSGGACSCADVDLSGGVNAVDVATFVADLLATTPCP